jgi:hypothetical protein
MIWTYLRGQVARRLMGGNDVLARNPQRAAAEMLWSLLAVEASAGASSKVVNDEFKFSVSVPAAMVSCEAASGTHPHGFTILLRPGKQGCSASTPQPYVGLFGDYNVLYAQAPAQTLNLLCPPSQGTAPGELENLAFPGHASALCRRNDRKGWVDLFVVTQAGSWPDKEPPDVPFINYTAQLHTRPARLAGDLEASKKILATVNISAK